MKWLKKVAATPLTTIARVVDSLQTQTNDRTNAPSIRAVNDAINNKWETIYPVGSIYMSVNNVNPSTVFGGTWQQIKDKFLLACGDTYNNGATGGSATNTLEVSQLPSHYHNFDKAMGANQTLLNTGMIPKHAHRYKTHLALTEIGYQTGSTTLNVCTGEQTIETSEIGSTDAYHSHSSLGYETAGTATTGNGAAINNMPPYLAVNVWVRTA